MAQIASYKNKNGSEPNATLEEISTYLVIYGSGWLAPNVTGVGSHNAGDQFKAVSIARYNINKQAHPNDNCIVVYCPTDIEFFETIDMYRNITRMDIYCHGWAQGLNLGGFIGNRMVGEIEYNSDDIDWAPLGDHDSEGRNLRQVTMSEINLLNSASFKESSEVYFWGCNIGGQLSPNGKHVLSNKYKIDDPKLSFAEHFAIKMGKGNVYALVGKGEAGGSMFKTDESGKEVYNDAEMIPANISANYNNKNTKKLKASDYMKKFPL
jgi:hypothetical protein